MEATEVMEVEVEVEVAEVVAGMEVEAGMEVDLVEEAAAAATELQCHPSRLHTGDLWDSRAT